MLEALSGEVNQDGEIITTGLRYYVIAFLALPLVVSRILLNSCILVFKNPFLRMLGVREVAKEWLLRG